MIVRSKYPRRLKEKVEDMTEEKLSGNQSFSKNKKNQTEIMDVSSVRMTRSREVR